MSDDIVTRLRNKRTEFDNWLNDIEGKHSFGHDESIWLDAADEIERLRKMSYDLYLGLTTSVLIANANELTREAWTTYNNYMIELKDQSTN